MSLSSAELKLVRESWAVVFKDPEGNGAFVLKTFLDKHNYYSKFARFKDAPRETITENPIFRNHAAKLMRLLNEAIGCLDQPDKLKPLLNGLGKGHKKRGIKPQQFEHLKVVIMDILKGTFKLPAPTLQAWDKVWGAALPLIFTGLK